MSRRTSHIRIVDAKNTRSGTSSEDDDTTERDDDGDTFDSLSSSDSNSNRPVRGFSPRKPRPYTQTSKGKGIASSQHNHQHNHNKHHRRDAPDRDQKKDDKRDSSPGEGPSRRNLSRRHSYRPAMDPYEDPFPPLGGYGGSMNPTTYPGAGSRYNRHVQSLPPMYPQSHSMNASPYGPPSNYPFIQGGGYGPSPNIFAPYSAPPGYMPQYVPQQIVVPAPPPPPTEVPPPPAPAPAPAPPPAPTSDDRIAREFEAMKEERRKAQELAALREMKSARENPEIENLKRELEEKRREMAERVREDQRKEEEARKREDETRLRKEIEESFRVRMDAMKKAEEETRAEMERLKVAADAEARAALQAEILANEKRQRENQAAIERAKKEAQEELLAQMRADAERRARDEEERRRSLEAAEAKVASEIEAQRKQREEDEETRNRLLRELKEEIRAEFLQEQSKGRTARAAQRTMPSNRHAAATPADSTVDPFEFFEGYSTPFPGQQEPGSFDESYWPRRQYPTAWPYQFPMPGGRDQGYMQARRGIPGASYEYHQRTVRPEDFSREQPTNPAAGNSQPAPRHSGDLNSNAPSSSSFASVNGDDSDKVTVIPSSTYKNGSHQPAQGVESHLNVGLANLNLANGDAGVSRTPNGVPHDLPGKQKQNGSTWSVLSTADDHDDRSVAPDTAAAVPDTDVGGANLESGTTMWPATNGRTPERFQTPPNRPSPVRKETARDSPLMPFLAKHLSDFEESSSQGRRSASRQSQTVADSKADDVFSRPVPTRDARYSEWVEDDGQQHDASLPYSLARRDQLAAGRQPGQQSQVPGGGFDYGAGFPMAFVPCVMVPVHMMQVPVFPASYQGIMGPRKNRRQQGMRG